MNIRTGNIEPIATFIDDAIQHDKSFAIALLPGSPLPYTFGFHENNVSTTEAQEKSSVSFEIIPWLGKYNNRCVFTHNKIINPSVLGSTDHIPTESTSLQAYYNATDAAITRCKERNGKTVISRVICGKFNECKPTIGNITERLFKKYPNTFRYIYYTPATGGWLAATPETLADIDMDANQVSTMAFAGTRRAGTLSQWDNKNRKENTFVVDYIVNRLQSLGLRAEVSDGENVLFGEIEHLCRRITAKISADVSVENIIDALNPTPALCGVPIEDAIHDIASLEAHPRGCYGGVVALSTNRRYRAFVNLRCMQFSCRSYCIYGGGGITPDSDTETEYLETEAKTSFLQSLVK